MWTRLRLRYWRQAVSAAIIAAAVIILSPFLSVVRASFVNPIAFAPLAGGIDPGHLVHPRTVMLCSENVAVRDNPVENL